MNHEFALYWAELSQHRKGRPAPLVITDSALVTRISHVLRLRPSEMFILFDREQHARCVLESVGKKELRVTVQSVEPNTVLQPTLTVCIPILKKEAFEEAIYSAVELGATEIQLFVTHKVQRSWGGQKEYERLQRIMIAAAEQSKHFAIPSLHEPVAFPFLVEHAAAEVIFLDAQGVPAFDCVTSLRHKKPNHVTVIIGPEGDLTAEEKMMLKEKGAVFCALTPTILRASQAVALGVAMIRSMIRHQ